MFEIMYDSQSNKDDDSNFKGPGKTELPETTERLLNSCRLCLSQNEDVPIFDKCHNTLKYAEIALTLANITITPSDNLPQNICLECSSKLVLFYKFKQKCELSHCTLTALIGNNVDKLKPDELKNKVNLANDKITIICGDRAENNDNLINFNTNGKESSPESSNLLHLNIDGSYIQEREQLFSCNVGDAVIFENSNESIMMVDSNSIRDKLKAKDKGIHQCQHCGKTFLRKSTLIQHFNTHAEKKFSCEICNKRFTRKNHVAVHMRGHNNERPYICDICSRGFTKSSDLIRHKKVHDDRKDFTCAVCGKMFKRSSDVSSHMNSHTGNRPYHCKHCDKAYTSHSSMMKHCRKYGHI